MLYLLILQPPYDVGFYSLLSEEGTFTVFQSLCCFCHWTLLPLDSCLDPLIHH